jgi:hypothetical protein
VGLVLRRAAALGVGLLAAMTACGNAGTSPEQAAPPTSAAPPLTVAMSSDAKPAVSDGRLTRTLVIDGGKLRLDPTSDLPRLSEDRAVRLWATGVSPGGVSVTEGAVVVLAKVTMTVPVTADGLALRPATMPTFNGRDAWVMLWQEGPHSCPALPVHPTGPGGLEPQPVEIIAADGSTDGVSYKTRGPFCSGPIRGPSAMPAVYGESLPWTVKSSTPTSVTIAYTVPACAVQSGGLTTSTRTSSTVWVGATVVMGAGPCPGAKPGPATSTVSRSAGADVTHGKTGLLIGRSSGGFQHLTYFDGQTRTLPVSQ